MLPSDPQEDTGGSWLFPPDITAHQWHDVRHTADLPEQYIARPPGCAAVTAVTGGGCNAAPAARAASTPTSCGQGMALPPALLPAVTAPPATLGAVTGALAASQVSARIVQCSTPVMAGGVPLGSSPAGPAVKGGAHLSQWQSRSLPLLQSEAPTKHSPVTPSASSPVLCRTSGPLTPSVFSLSPSCLGTVPSTASLEGQGSMSDVAITLAVTTPSQADTPHLKKRGHARHSSCDSTSSHLAPAEPLSSCDGSMILDGGMGEITAAPSMPVSHRPAAWPAAKLAACFGTVTADDAKASYPSNCRTDSHAVAASCPCIVLPMMMAVASPVIAPFRSVIMEPTSVGMVGVVSEGGASEASQCHTALKHTVDSGGAAEPPPPSVSVSPSHASDSGSSGSDSRDVTESTGSTGNSAPAVTATVTGGGGGGGSSGGWLKKVRSIGRGGGKGAAGGKGGGGGGGG